MGYGSYFVTKNLDVVFSDIHDIDYTCKKKRKLDQSLGHHLKKLLKTTKKEKEKVDIMFLNASSIGNYLSNEVKRQIGYSKHLDIYCNFT